MGIILSTFTFCNVCDDLIMSSALLSHKNNVPFFRFGQSICSIDFQGHQSRVKAQCDKMFYKALKQNRDQKVENNNNFQGHFNNTLSIGKITKVYWKWVVSYSLSHMTYKQVRSSQSEWGLRTHVTSRWMRGRQYDLYASPPDHWQRYVVC